MPGLRGTPAVTMHDVGALDRGIVVGAGELRVEAVDRGGLREVERLALRRAFGDVEQDDVAEFLEADEVGQRAADLAGADQCDLVARHGCSSSFDLVVQSVDAGATPGFPQAADMGRHVPPSSALSSREKD